MSNHRRAAAAPRSDGRSSRLGNDFLSDLDRDYRAHGLSAIARIRKNEPRHYVRLLLSLVPRRTHSETDWIEGLSDEDLEAVLRLARAQCAKFDSEEA